MEELIWLEEVSENPMALLMAIDEWGKAARDIRKGKQSEIDFRNLTRRIVLWANTDQCSHIDVKCLSHFEAAYRRGRSLPAKEEISIVLDQLSHVVKIRIDSLVSQVLTESVSSSQAKRKRKNENDPRDLWIYQQLCEGVLLKRIVRELKQRKEWTPVDTEQAVRQAGHRYAKRHDMPLPPKRTD